MAKLLVIDDEKLIRDTLEAVLSSKGHTVMTASDGQAGIEVFKQFKPDIVILDRNMSGMTGFEVCKRIKSLERGVDIIVLTGYPDEEGIIKFEDLGAQAFISKGYAPEKLLETIEVLMRRRVPLNSK